MSRKVDKQGFKKENFIILEYLVAKVIILPLEKF